jgi:sulfatase maturation enzyme AslB (radical SAM superfamily)
MRQPENTNFCYYPFFQVILGADGKYRPCSKHMDDITHNGTVLHSSFASLNDAWNSDYMQDMRNHFNANKQFAGCGECHRLQKMGLRSMRYDSYEYNISEEQVANPVTPVRVELNSSNICNLKCRICSPRASNKWLPEASKFYHADESVHLNLTADNTEQVKFWAPHLEEICFFGGEPLLSHENLEILKFLIDTGRAEKVAILFNTNGTIFNDEIAVMLSRFKQVRISFSIDDIGERFEYQRSGAKWAQAEKNLQKAYAYSQTPAWQNVEFRICNSLSTLNVYYMPEFFNYFNENFPGLRIVWNFLYHPSEFSIQILPKPVKEIIKERISKEVKATFTLSENETRTVQDLITYLEYHEEGNFSLFFKTINRHDVYRRESFAKTFPEFWELIKDYKDEKLVMGMYDKRDWWMSEHERKPYDPNLNYYNIVAGDLNHFLENNYSPSEIPIVKKKFYDVMDELNALTEHEQNKFYYIATLSPIGIAVEDIFKLTVEQIFKQLKRFKFKDDKNTYDPKEDYYPIVANELISFLQARYDGDKIEENEKEFHEKINELAYNFGMHVNKVYYLLTLGPIDVSYHDFNKLPEEQFLIGLQKLSPELV